jgi:hypothetical protein
LPHALSVPVDESWLADPERIFQARRASFRCGLVDTGMDEATEDRWCDAWEIECRASLWLGMAVLERGLGLDRRRAGATGTNVGRLRALEPHRRYGRGDDDGRAMTDMPGVGSRALVARSIDCIDDVVHAL